MVHVDIPENNLSAEILREAIAGEVATIPSSAALTLLSDIDAPGVDPAALLRDAVGNPDLARHVRIGAMGIYSRVAGSDSIPLLVDALDDADDGVGRAAAAALGNVGTPSELEALRRVRERGDGPTSERATFAAALIVHRFGLSDHQVDLAQPETQEVPAAAGGMTFASVRPGLRRRDQALKAINRYLPWFDVSKQDVYEVQCGRRLLAIAVDLDVQQLSGRPAVPAVVAVQDPEYGEFHPSLIALSHPTSEGRVAVRLSRPSGEAVYVGEASVQDGRVELGLRAVMAPGVAPVVARVHATASGIEISGVSSRQVTTKRSPQRDPSMEG
ncbi:hypothetical protein JOF56_008543 [Kibdelosporangium banguiense]|uniref:HEAT repeat domain-containing protein n=1 Tax=Kibdelosporangium banguiense TaxID=1365924 RepID=A0ABS4TUS1_9PSEU|nr:HEAT repeat domain-containing protein [Kibdelosporangium banguiense]MBP2328158.1 hypothetical protein [Kibdelosporangium banguiense]